MRRRPSTSFWHNLRRGPWPEKVIERLVAALDALAQRLRAYDEVAALILFGSYARGIFGRNGDVDLLVLLELIDSVETEAPAERTDTGCTALRLVGEAEAEARLPMHLAPLLARVDRLTDLGPELLHDLWTDGVVLYARAHGLAGLQPEGLAAWTLVRFSAARAQPHERVRLSRRLHGARGRPGIVRPPALTLGRGALLVPAGQQQAVREALDEAGATYDLIPVWREA